MMEDVERFFIEEFQWIDDIAEDVAERDRIVMEARASLLIEANCSSERFPAFMKYGWYSSNEKSWVYDLPKPIVLKNERSQSEFRNFIVYNGNLREQTHYNLNQSGRWQLKLNKPSPNDDSYDNIAREAIARLWQKYRSIFQLCQLISPYNTPEKVCRFFGQEANAFGPLKMRERWPDSFYCANMTATEKAFVPPPGMCVSEAVHVGNVLEGIVRGPLWNAIHYPLWDTSYDGWLKQAFWFNNEYGETIMIVIKLYNPKTQTKILVPATQWMTSGSTENKLHCVPWPDKLQPLYHLDLLAKQENSVVILTDSIEIADLNQAKCPDGAVFSSFICEPDRYDQVDWSPLAEKEVYFLITNHSGITLEAVYVKAKELADYLEEEAGINLKFIQVETCYGEKPHFRNIDEILETYREFKPQVNPDSIMFLEYNEFEALYEKAVEKINSKPLEFWRKQFPNQEQLRVIERESNRPQPIDYIMHPFFIKGAATMLHGAKSVGKSALSMSIAARVVSAGAVKPPALFFSEKWWSLPQKGMKVLYLDYENGEVERQRRMKNFCEPYYPADDVKRRECEANLIFKDMVKETLDYSAPENHQKLIDMIDRAGDEGTPGLPVTLLVIDTYTGFVRSENPQTSANFKEIIRKICDKGVGTLIVHHTNSEGEARGLKDKLDILYAKLRIYRNGNVSDNLDESIIFVPEEYRGSLPKSQRESFQFRYSEAERKWCVTDAGRTENQELKAIYTNYKKQGYDRDAICQMVGLKKSALAKRLKKIE